MYNQPVNQPKVVYEADTVHVQTVKSLRDKLHGVCKKELMHKYVKVQTIDGHEYEGVIVHLDGGQIYLSLAQDHDHGHGGMHGYPHAQYPYPGYMGGAPAGYPAGHAAGYPGAGPVGYDMRVPFAPYPPFPPFNPSSAILPLVLYDLLAITLLYT